MAGDNSKPVSGGGGGVVPDRNTRFLLYSFYFEPKNPKWGKTLLRSRSTHPRRKEHEDKGVGTLKAKSIVFVPFLVLIVGDYYHIGSSGNRRATSGNLRGRAENGEETTLGVGTTRTIFVNRLQGVLRLLLGSRIHGRRRRVGTTLLLEGETVSRLPLAWRHCVPVLGWKILRQPSCFYRGENPK